MGLGISFRIICLFFSFQSGSGGISQGGERTIRAVCWRNHSVWSEVLGALVVAEILRFRSNKMGCWKKWSLSFFLPCLTDSLSLHICFSVSVSYSVLLSVSSFIWICACSFCLLTYIGRQVGRGIKSKQWLGNLNAKRNSPISDISKVLLNCCRFNFISLHQSTLETVTLLVLCAVIVKDTCSALQVHMSASKSSSCRFNKAFSRLLF